MASEIAAPKPDLDAKAKKIRFWSTFKGILKGKLLAPKLRKSPDKWLSQPGCSHSNTDSKTPYTTHTQAHPKQLEATVTLRQKKPINRPQPQPSHTRGTFHRRLQPLYTEKHKVSCSGFLPKTEPMQHHAAIPMGSATTDSKHPITTHTQPHPKQLEATVTLRQKKNDKPTAAATVAHTRYLSSSPAATLHGKTQGFVLRLPPQNIAHARSCSHSNTICKHRFQNTL